VSGKEWLEKLLGAGLVGRRLHLRSADVVFVKGVLEASEGLGALFAEPRGRSSERTSATGLRRDRSSVVIAAPLARAAELERTIADLRDELGGALWEEAEEVDGDREDERDHGGRGPA
jgi:hypothetical protein